jgi:hypothetical protein
MRAILAAFLLSVSAERIMALSCDRSVAHAVQVAFADCGDVPDNVSVHLDNNVGELLPLTKSPRGYWEADKSAFKPAKLTLCAHTCSATSGCARLSETVEIDRGTGPVCAARYVIRCTEQMWTLHVDTVPARWLVYKRLKRTNGVMTTPEQGGKWPPFDICDLAYDEQVELAFKEIDISIPLKPISAESLEHGTAVVRSRDELAREIQIALKHALSDRELQLLPMRVTFTLNRK